VLKMSVNTPLCVNDLISFDRELIAGVVVRSTAVIISFPED
jgi:hypothetical protein